MAVSLLVLQSLASTFTTVLEGPPQVQPGKPVNLRLVPATAEGLRVTDIVPARMNLTWITKSVRFSTHTVEPVFQAASFDPASLNGLLAGGMPARVPVVGGIGVESLQGVPGELAQLAGEIPVAVEVPVSVSVTWEVLDEAGNATISGFSAPAGMSGPEVRLEFEVQTVELTTSMGAPVAHRSVRATVTLAAGTTTHSFTLPPVQLQIPAIPVPAVVAFFLHGNFAGARGDDDGAALVIVPSDSPLRSLSQLQSQLGTLRSAVSGVSHLANFAAFLTGIDALSGALSAQVNVEFRVANGSNDYDDFNDVTLLEKFLGFVFGWSNIEAEDELSSMIVIGPEGKRVQLFNHRDQDSGHGRFDVTVGPKLHVTIPNLHSAAPASGPDGSEVTVSTAPPAGLFQPSTFGDELSSLRFG